jgi:hypothetical protein
MEFFLIKSLLGVFRASRQDSLPEQRQSGCHWETCRMEKIPKHKTIRKFG